MYKATFKRKEIILNNKDYKQILRRFDPKKFKQVTGDCFTYSYVNNIECPLCIKYENCDPCPFSVVNDKYIEPCMSFMYSAFKGNRTKYRNHFPMITYDYVKIKTNTAAEADEKFYVVSLIHNLFKDKFKKIEL